MILYNFFLNQFKEKRNKQSWVIVITQLTSPMSFWPHVNVNYCNYCTQSKDVV